MCEKSFTVDGIETGSLPVSANENTHTSPKDPKTKKQNNGGEKPVTEKTKNRTNGAVVFPANKLFRHKVKE